MLLRNARTLAALVLLATAIPAQDLAYTFTGLVESIGGVAPPAPWSGVQVGDPFEIYLEASPGNPILLSGTDAIFDDTTMMGWSLAGIPQVPRVTTANVLFVANDDLNDVGECCDGYQWSANIGSSTTLINLQECVAPGSGCPNAVPNLAFPTSIPLEPFTGNRTGGINVGGSFITGTILTATVFETADFTDVCNGDGGDQMGCTDCPCLNNAAPRAIGGCLNSAGTSTRLLASGSPSITSASLRFEAAGAPPNTSSVLTSGNALAPANAANPCFGLNSGLQAVALDGLRCAVQGVLRHGVRPSAANGTIGAMTNGWGTPNGFFNFSAFTAGATKHFQIVHRDDLATTCMTGQNTSQAITTTFTP